MRYTDVAKMIKKANPVVTLGVEAAPYVAPGLAIATQPVVSVPAMAAGGFIGGKRLYKSLLGNRVDKAYDNLQKQTNDTAKTYREYLKWRNNGKPAVGPRLIPLEPSSRPDQAPTLHNYFESAMRAAPKPSDNKGFNRLFGVGKAKQNALNSIGETLGAYQKYDRWAQERKQKAEQAQK